jgi:hypothetical protein
MKVLLKGLLAVVLIIVLIPLILGAALVVKKWVDNSRFAREFFAEKIEIVRGVASKRWHDYTEGPHGCTWAIVEFSHDTASTLRRVGRLGDSCRSMNWVQWPIAAPSPHGRASWTHPAPSAASVYYPPSASLPQRSMPDSRSPEPPPVPGHRSRPTAGQSSTPRSRTPKKAGVRALPLRGVSREIR